MTDALDSVWGQNPHLLPRLRELAVKGVSASSIARSLKVSRNAVIGKADREGIKLKGTMRRVGRRVYAKPVEERHYAQPSPPRRFSWQ